MAEFLALPTERIDRDFANGFLYLSSFCISQPELLKAVMRATSTKEEEWSLEYKTCQNRMDEGQTKLRAGDKSGTFDVIYAHTMLGIDYEAKTRNEMLGLPKEGLDEVIREVAKKSVPGGWDLGSTLKLG
jgi:hypothetical protein